MKALTTEGRQYVAEIADKYDIQTESVESLLRAVINGGGRMAQFNIPELGGQGQWMRGGVTMVGDMFNNDLRTTVDKICNELADTVSTSVLFEESAETADSKTNAVIGKGSASWPPTFGNPTSSGTQNNFRYAYFSPVNRLVIDDNGKRTIYDTQHHRISGVSQQQGPDSVHRFTSQDGEVDLGSLPVVSEAGGNTQPTPEIAYDVTSNADLSGNSSSPQDIIISTIEKINVLFERGQITEEEFKAKKQELLQRL